VKKRPTRANKKNLRQKNSSKPTPQKQPQKEVVTSEEVQKTLKFQSEAEEVSDVPSKSIPPVSLRTKIISCFVLVLLSGIIFSNVSDHQYVLDDLPTIAGNKFVQKGFAGFPEIMFTRAWDGYNADINIAVYRPTQLLMYATEYEFVNPPKEGEVKQGISGVLSGLIDNLGTHNWVSSLGLHASGISHLMNVFYYMVLCIFIYLTFVELFQGKYRGLPFIIALIFVVHPLHSEPVSNLKSRDELIALMFSFIAFYNLIRYVDTDKIYYIIIASVMYFVGLLSKETPVAFMGIFPVTFYFFRPHLSYKEIAIKTFLPFVVSFVVYLGMRQYVLEVVAKGIRFKHTHLQNPLLNAKGGSENIGTRLWIWGKYLQLMFFPHPLTFTYFYDGVPILKMTHPKAVASLLIHIVMVWQTFKGLKTRSIYSYALWMYFGTIFLFMHIVISPGDAIGERMAFAATTGFCIFVAWFIYRLLNIQPEMTIGEFFKANFSKVPSIIALVGFTALLVAFGYKTHTRNMAWHDNTTLCETDYPTSPRSYILNRQLGLTYLAFYDTLSLQKEKFKTLEEQKLHYLTESLKYFRDAVVLDPNNPALWIKYGEASTKNGDLGTATQCYANAYQVQPANINYGIKAAELYRKTAQNLKKEASKKKNYGKAIGILKKIASDPKYVNNHHVNRELALNYYSMQDYNKAEPYFKKALQFAQNNRDKSIIHSDMASMYYSQERLQEAFDNFRQAVQLFPNYDVPFNGLGVIYYRQGNLQEAARFFVQAYNLNNQNVEAVNNLRSLYQALNNQAEYNRYNQIYQQLTGGQ